MSALRLMWFVQPPVVAVASTLGLVARDAAISTRSRSSDEQFDALVRGDTDLVVTAMDNVIAWNRRAGPADFRIVAQVERTTPLSLIARPGIDSVADLQGGVALVDAPENGFVIALRALLAGAGLSTADIALRPAGGVQERLDALLAGLGSCTLLGPPFDAVARRSGLVCLATVQENWPTFPGQGLVMRQSKLAKLGVRLTPWLRGLGAAARLMASNDAAAAQALSETGYAPAMLPMTLGLGPLTLIPTVEGVEVLATQRRQLGLAGGDDRYEALVDLSLLDKP